MPFISFKSKKKTDFKLDETNSNSTANKKQTETQSKSNIKTVDQIKNIAQEIKNKPEIETDVKAIDNILINSFDELLNICSKKKEKTLRQKYRWGEKGYARKIYKN